MPDVRVARPLLEDTSMTDTNTPANAIEPMIDAKQALVMLAVIVFGFPGQLVQHMAIVLLVAGE